MKFHKMYETSDLLDHLVYASCVLSRNFLRWCDKHTGRYMWQVHLGYDKWEDVEPTWAEPLSQALRDGVRTIRLSHSYQNKFGEEVRSWYTIDCQHTKYYMTQMNETTGRRRWLRAVHLMALPAMTLPPPTEPLADPAGPADVPTDL